MRRRALLLLPLAGCTAPPRSRTEAPPTEWLPADRPAGGRLWQADVAASRLRILAFRAGSLARLGHHHILQAQRFEAQLWLPAQGLQGAQGGLRVRLDDLELDRPEWRAAAGGEFNEKPVDAEAIAATQLNLLRALRAQQHPEVRVQLLSLHGAAPWWQAELRLWLAGQAADYWVALQVQAEDERLQLRGALVLQHQRHGLAPFSLPAGLLSVQDAVQLDFELVLRASAP